jgi:hypothetical protein
MLDSLCPIPKCLTTHLSSSSVYVNEVPCALMAKAKKQRITKVGGGTFKSLTILPHVYVPMGVSVLEA